MKPSAIVLLSGGLDSATVLAIVKSEGYNIRALSFSYGQRHIFELQKASQLAQHYKCQHSLIHLDPSLFQGSALVGEDLEVPNHSTNKQGIPITYVPARNILFLSHALALAESHNIANIFLGINVIDYSGYPDCRPEFIEAFQKMAALGMRCSVEGMPIQIHAPLLHLNKKEIIKKGMALGLDYSLTTSCYRPGYSGEPCQNCDSCLFRSQGFAQAGCEDPLLHK